MCNGSHPLCAEALRDRVDLITRTIQDPPVSYTHLDVYKRQPYTGANVQIVPLTGYFVLASRIG